ncbi:MAG: glutamyl-tRNA reductase [Bacteroidetes bacterium]|nr:glutamyl-tRNA reductase [Bacteroidota bacterium]
MYDTLQIIAFTHNNLDVNEIGCLHIERDQLESRLKDVKAKMHWTEFQFLSTCNRVEFIFCGKTRIDSTNFSTIFSFLYPEISTEKSIEYGKKANYFYGKDAVNHIFRVASSIDSMVIGEREIITQVRNAYELGHQLGLTGDFLRILTKQTIATAKRVYTETSISKKPVSVVSLAYQRMKELNIPLDARVLVVGAGVTNTTLSRFLKKHGYSKFSVFNRTFSKAESLAKELKGKAYPLTQLNDFNEGFDVLIACTGTDHHIVTPEIYERLLIGETDKKLVIDIAIPQDLDPKIIQEHNVFHISVSYLQKVSDENLKHRSSEIQQVEKIIDESIVSFNRLNHERNIELAMREVPKKVKDIKTIAMNEVFRSELESLDPNSKEVLEKIVGYLEKKYMSMPMKMAKEILLNKD